MKGLRGIGGGGVWRGGGFAKITLQPISFHPPVTRDSASHLGRGASRESTVWGRRGKRASHHLLHLMARGAEWQQGRRRAKARAPESDWPESEPQCCVALGKFLDLQLLKVSIGKMR